MVVLIKRSIVIGIGALVVLLAIGGLYLWNLNRPISEAPLKVRIGATYGLYLYDDATLEVIQGTLMEDAFEWGKIRSRKRVTLSNEVYSEIITSATRLNEIDAETGYFMTGYWGTDITITYNDKDFFILYNYPEAIVNLKGGNVSDEYTETVNAVRKITDLLVQNSPIIINISEYS